ncbi:MAG: CAP domain-containing protein [Deltaproteobacteria bacterium]|nr:CAP domain-containing protein [Deltaproteobacteria bacterium]
MNSTRFSGLPLPAACEPAPRKARSRAGVAALVRPWLPTWVLPWMLPWVLVLAAGGCVNTAAPPARPAPPPLDRAATTEPGSPSTEERRLHQLLNEYRAANHLPPVGLSRSLSKIARLHASDLSAHRLAAACSIHSWSASGPWSPCCYDQRRPDTKCMWNKPRELTPYEGIGFEIAYRYTAGVRAKGALAAWQASARHKSIVLNLDGWKSRQWRAVGVGIDGEYATVWWGDEVDPAGYWR